MSERGSVTAFTVVFTVALLAVAGLVADGGQVIAAHRRAFNEAEAAARAGAQSIDVAALRATGDVKIDPVVARDRAVTHAAERGLAAEAVVEGDRVEVTVRFEQPLALLGAFGLGPVEVEGSGVARAVRGVRTGGDL